MKQALLAAGAALAAAAWWYYKRKTAPKPPPKPQPKKRRLCACGCGKVASMRCGRCKTARYATRECQASHARAHAPVCYFDSGVQAMDAGEPRKAAKLFETSIAKADKLPPEAAEERVKRRSAAYLAMGRARQMVKEFDAALAAYAAGVKSARAANVPADAVECMVGAANVVRATDGAAAAVELFAAAAARADEALASGGARRGPGALPGADATRLVAARASAWANQAEPLLDVRRQGRRVLGRRWWRADLGQPRQGHAALRRLADVVTTAALEPGAAVPQQRISSSRNFRGGVDRPSQGCGFALGLVRTFFRDPALRVQARHGLGRGGARRVALAVGRRRRRARRLVGWGFGCCRHSALSRYTVGASAVSGRLSLLSLATRGGLWQAYERRLGLRTIWSLW